MPPLYLLSIICLSPGIAIASPEPDIPLKLNRALLDAVEHEDSGLVRKLLHKGADPNFCDALVVGDSKPDPRRSILLVALSGDQPLLTPIHTKGFTGYKSYTSALHTVGNYPERVKIVKSLLALGLIQT